MLDESFWTQERRRMLNELWSNSTLSATQIGAKLGCNRNAVMGAVRRQGLTPRLEKPMKQQAFEYWRSQFPHCVRLYDHVEGQCRHPLGDSKNMDAFFYCGAPVHDGSYCLHHYRLNIEGKQKGYAPRPIYPRQ